MNDLKKTKLVVAIIFLFLFSLSFMHAQTLCSTTYVAQTWTQGDSPTKTITCTNQNNVSSVTLNSKYGNFFSVQPSIPITLPPLTPTTVTINFDSDADAGNHAGILTFSDGSESIILNMTVQEGETVSGGISFPTSKNFNVKQGDTYNKELKLIMPSNYGDAILIQTIDFSGESSILRFGDKEEGVYVNPGDVFTIPLVIDATEAQAGEYPSIDVIVRYDDGSGAIKQLKSSITIYVSATVNPSGSDTFSSPPTCALSATTLNLNNTYSFTCSGVVSNLVVDIPSSDYYIGKSVEVSSGLYRYDFSPVEYGETTFKADFKYNGASIFSPFKQDIKITSAGTVTPGTNLKFIFTPTLEDAQKGDTIILQIVDNKTGSLVKDPVILINAKEINKTGDYSFEYVFEPDKNYELRGKANGYEDLVQTVKFSPTEIEIHLNPSSGDVSTMFNITTSVENATITIKGTEYSNNYYGTLPPGNIEIKASKLGYNSATLNISVGDNYRIVSGGNEFKKGEEQVFTLNKNASLIKVLYLKNIEQDRATAEDYFSSSGTSLTFTPKKSGIYILVADGIDIGTFEAKGFSFTNKWWILPNWVWILIIIIILIFVGMLLVRKNNIASSNPDDEMGLVFNAGDAGP